MRHIHELDAHARRVLGALLEKEQTTPEYYPLTLNALITACNQTTNREPVMSLERYEVLRALHALEKDGLVERVTGPRADRWSHLLIQPVYVRPANKALLTVLLLRGAQTLGELKGRTERMHLFQSLEEIAESLHALADWDPPLVREIPRRPGQKDPRWLLNLPPEDSEAIVQVAAASREETVSPDPLEARVQRLERLVAQILDRLGPLE